MSRFTKPGLSHSTTIGGTGISIDQIDLGAILIGDGQGFTLGTLAAGSGVSIVNGDGVITISGVAAYTLPTASSSVLGGIKVGTGLSIDDTGILSTTFSGDAAQITTGLLATTRGGTGLDTSSAANGTLLIGTGSGLALATLTAGANLSITNTAGHIQIDFVGGGPGVGTVTSVDLSVPGEFSVSGNPITSAGTLTVTKATQISNKVYAAPDGSTGVPIFRLLTTNDIPSLDAGKITSGTLSASLLPVATGSTLGAIKVGTTLSIASGVLDYSLPTASAGTLGGIKVGSGLSITSGVLSTVTNGTVTSVSLSAPSELSVAGSPITGAGTLALTWANETGNTVFASPSGGGSGTPGFRSLVTADIPNLDAGKITTGLLATTRGGTGVDSSTASNGQLLIGTGTGLSLHTLSAGANITITNASGLITIASTGGGGSTSPLTTKGDIWGFTTVDARQAVGEDGTFLSADSSQSTGLAYRFPAGVAGVATLSNYLSADVTMTTAGTFYDGPSLSLTEGTWLLIGNVALTNGSFATDFLAKLWDGTTTYSSNVPSARNVATASVHVPLQAIVSPTTTTTYKISAEADNSSSTIQATSTMSGTVAVTNRSSYLVAVQLTGAPASGPGALMPAVRVKSSTGLVISNSTYTNLTFDTTEFDQGTSSPQHSTSSNTSRLTCQQAGVYQITATVGWPSNATGIRQLFLNINGTAFADNEIASAGAAAATAQTVTGMYKLSVGDYVEAMVFQSSGSNLTIAVNQEAGAVFMMARIDSGPGAVQPNTKVQLNYVARTDLASGTSLTANTWADLGSNQTFTVDDSNSIVEILVSGNALIGTNASTVASRIVVDSSGTPQNFFLGSGIGSGPSSNYGNPIQGATIPVSGLSSGSHTVKVQVLTVDSSQLLYCRPSTHPNEEGLAIRVLERKQSSSPPSSTPAPAVRCYNSANISISSATLTALTFDSNRYDQGTSTVQHSVSSNTSRLTCQQAGVYNITGNIDWSGVSSAGTRLVYIRLNGTNIIAVQYEPPAIAGGYDNYFSISSQYQLAVGDYAELLVYQDSGIAIQLNHTANYSPEFMMARVDSGGQGFVPIPNVQTGSYAILNSDCLVVAGANSLTFTLPLASSRAPGMPIVVKNDNFTTTTIARAGSDIIDGATSYSLPSAYGSVTLVGDGVSTYRVI